MFLNIKTELKGILSGLLIFLSFASSVPDIKFYRRLCQNDKSVIHLEIHSTSQDQTFTYENVFSKVEEELSKLRIDNSKDLAKVCDELFDASSFKDFVIDLNKINLIIINSKNQNESDITLVNSDNLKEDIRQKKIIDTKERGFARVNTKVNFRKVIENEKAFFTSKNAKQPIKDDRSTDNSSRDTEHSVDGILEESSHSSLDYIQNDSMKNLIELQASPEVLLNTQDLNCNDLNKIEKDQETTLKSTNHHSNLKNTSEHDENESLRVQDVETVEVDLNNNSESLPNLDSKVISNTKEVCQSQESLERSEIDDNSQQKSSLKSFSSCSNLLRLAFYDEIQNVQQKEVKSHDFGFSNNSIEHIDTSRVFIDFINNESNDSLFPEYKTLNVSIVRFTIWGNILNDEIILDKAFEVTNNTHILFLLNLMHNSLLLASTALNSGLIRLEPSLIDPLSNFSSPHLLYSREDQTSNIFLIQASSKINKKKCKKITFAFFISVAKFDTDAFGNRTEMSGSDIEVKKKLNLENAEYARRHMPEPFNSGYTPINNSKHIDKISLLLIPCFYSYKELETTKGFYLSAVEATVMELDLSKVKTCDFFCKKPKFKKSIFYKQIVEKNTVILKVYQKRCFKHLKLENKIFFGLKHLIKIPIKTRQLKNFRLSLFVSDKLPKAIQTGSVLDLFAYNFDLQCKLLDDRSVDSKYTNHKENNLIINYDEETSIEENSEIDKTNNEVQILNEIIVDDTGSECVMQDKENSEMDKLNNEVQIFNEIIVNDRSSECVMRDEEYARSSSVLKHPLPCNADKLISRYNKEDSSIISKWNYNIDTLNKNSNYIKKLNEKQSLENETGELEYKTSKDQALSSLLSIFQSRENTLNENIDDRKRKPCFDSKETNNCNTNRIKCVGIYVSSSNGIIESPIRCFEGSESIICRSTVARHYGEVNMLLSAGKAIQLASSSNGYTSNRGVNFSLNGLEVENQNENSIDKVVDTIVGDFQKSSCANSIREKFIAYKDKCNEVECFKENESLFSYIEEENGNKSADSLSFFSMNMLFIGLLTIFLIFLTLNLYRTVYCKRKKK